MWPLRRKKHTKKRYAVTHKRSGDNVSFYVASEVAKLSDGSVMASVREGSYEFRLFADGTGVGEYGPVTWIEVVDDPR